MDFSSFVNNIPDFDNAIYQLEVFLDDLKSTPLFFATLFSKIPFPFVMPIYYFVMVLFILFVIRSWRGN